MTGDPAIMAAVTEAFGWGLLLGLFLGIAISATYGWLRREWQRERRAR